MKTTEEMQKEIQQKFPFIELLEEYKGANEKIALRCNNCGHKWKAVPRSVAASKHGCPKCGVQNARQQKAKELFISRLDSSKYELIEYKDYTDVTVKCKICGNIRHTSSANILKYGCKVCSSKEQGEKRRLSVQEFINKANTVHNNKYDYSKVVYSNSHTPVTIICPIHGEFQQSPTHHLSGEGCPKCVKKEWNTEEFIKESQKAHGTKYNYTKVNYINFTTKVCIICPEHGEFWQLPYIHCKVGCGCPKCKQSHGERLISSILNCNSIKYISQFPLENPYNRRNFKLDFYILYNKGKYIIEYNGRQHYEPVEVFGGQKAFEEQLLRDSDLRKYCKENNWNLLEIPFYYSEEEIINSIQEFLNLPSINEKSNGLLQDNIGESCDANTEITSEIKESETSQSVGIEPPIIGE